MNINKALNNYKKHNEPEKFYENIIKMVASSNKLYPRKVPQENWSEYKTEEKYEESLDNCVTFSKNFTKKEKESFDTIIYQKANSDGLISAYIAWKYLDKKPTLIPSDPDHGAKGVSYKIKKIEEHLLKDKNVLMVDLSHNKETLEYVNSITNFFVSIDNHTPIDLDYAFSTLSDTNNKKAHAACAAVWKFFYPKEKVPYFVQAVDSTDMKLYLSYMPDPSPFSTAMAVKFTKNQKYRDPNLLFEALDTFLTDSSDIQAVNFISILGFMMDKYGENMKKEIVSKAVKAKFNFKGNKYDVYVLNYSQPGLLKRVLINMADSHYQDSDFAVIWFYDHRAREFEVAMYLSQRKKNSKVNIQDIAKHFGGGGSKYSARFRLKGKPGNIGDIIE
jgi:hypothetical protein